MGVKTMYKINTMNIEDYNEIMSLWKNTDGIGLSGNDDSPIKNTLIAGPIQIGDKPEILVVRLRIVKGHDNKFYVHDIFVNELIKNKGNTIKAGSMGNPVGETSKSIAYIRNILHSIMNVK